MPEARDIFKAKGTPVFRGEKEFTDLSPAVDEVKELLASCRNERGYYGPVAYRLFTFMANIGLRISEVISIERESFHYLKASHSFSVMRLKKKKPFQGSVVVCPKEEELIAEILSGSGGERLFPFTARTAQYIFAHYAKQAGIRPWLSTHSLRRFCAQQILDSTESILLVKIRLGHSMDMTERYLAGAWSRERISQALSKKPIYR